MWVNLPAKHKMDPPRYQDVPSRSIPHFDAAPGVRAKVIAGECAGVRAVVQTLVPVQARPARALTVRCAAPRHAAH